MLKGPLASLERHDRPAFEGRSGSERSTEPGSSAKTVASQPVVGYRIRSRTAKKEILDKEIRARDKTSLDIFWLKDKSLTDMDNLPEPDELAEEIIENLEAGLESFRQVLTELGLK